MIVRQIVVNLIFITIDLINMESTLHVIARFSDPNIEVLIWYMAVFTAVDVSVRQNYGQGKLYRLVERILRSSLCK